MKESIIVKDFNLLDLPENEIILKIIGYLSPTDWLNLRAVSKHTYYLVNEFFKYMKHLDLTTNQHCPPSLYQIFTQTCQSLQVLKVSKVDCFNEDTLKKILQNNHNLKYLDLTNSRSLKNGTLQPLVVNCRNLDTIILKNCPWVTVGALEILAFHFPDAIREADFSGCTAVSEASIILFIKRQSKLESLVVSDLHCIRNETLAVISQTCHHLRHLDVARCPGITDDGIQVISEYCHSLQSLKVEGCPKISERSLGELRSRRVRIDKLQYPAFMMLRKHPVQISSRMNL